MLDPLTTLKVQQVASNMYNAPQPNTEFLFKYQLAIPSAITALAAGAQKCDLSSDFAPGEYDVVCGRGKGSYNRPGNMHFRAIVRDHIDEYLAARSKIDKSLVLNKIIEEVREQDEGRARFVKQDKAGKWIEIGNEVAREKCGHAIREAIAARNDQASLDALLPPDATLSCVMAASV